jgi:hypothetical protein
VRRQHADGKRIGCLVDRPTEVDAHHAAQQNAQQHGVSGAHGVEEFRQAHKHARHRWPDQVDHRQAGEQARQQRDDQDRLERIQALRQLEQGFLQHV